MLAIEPWKIEDAALIVNVRNTPHLRQWFRQDHDLTLEEQKAFMLSHPDYHGYIIWDYCEHGGVAVGVVANHKEELCIAAPYEYHKEAIKLLEETEHPTRLYGDVLHGNPMLQTYLDAGFEIKSVRIEKCVS